MLRTRAELHTYLRAVPEPDAVRDLRRAGREDLAWRRRGRQTTITFGTVKPTPIRLVASNDQCNLLEPDAS